MMNLEDLTLRLPVPAKLKQSVIRDICQEVTALYIVVLKERTGIDIRPFLVGADLVRINGSKQ